MSVAERSLARMIEYTLTALYFRVRNVQPMNYLDPEVAVVPQD
jgi:hypothetical protein